MSLPEDGEQTSLRSFRCEDNHRRSHEHEKDQHPEVANAPLLELEQEIPPFQVRVVPTMEFQTYIALAFRCRSVDQ